MHQLYRLLRNNKETGPYSLEELAGNDLSTTDLIWVEGKSTYWKNPHDIEELVPLFGSNGKKEDLINTPGVEENPYHVAALSLNAGSEADKSNNESQYPLKELSQSYHPAVSEILFNRVKPDPSFEQNQTLPEVNRNREHLYPETTWEYLPFKKRRRHSQVFPLLFIGSLLLIATLLFFSGNVATKNNEGKKAADGRMDKNILPQKNQNAEVSSVLKKHDGDLNHQIADHATHTPKTSLQSGSAISAYAKPDRENLHGKIKPLNSSPSKARIQKMHSVDAVQTIQTEHSSPSILQSDNIPVQQVFSLYGMHPVTHQQGVAAFKLTITNNSDVLRFAAVDVFYKKNGQLTNKETLYFKNIAPHQSVTLTAPANQAADDVSYKLGLVSNEDGAIYVGN